MTRSQDAPEDRGGGRGASRGSRGGRPAALLLALLLLALIPAAALAQVLMPEPGFARAWAMGVWGESGLVSGWVQVRENAIEGTRLGLRGDLGVNVLSGWGFQVTRRMGASSSLGLTVGSYRLVGRATPPQPVFFNGATLQAGAPLETDVSFPDYLRVTLLYRRRLTRRHAPVSLGLRAGLDVTLITFRLHGTLAPNTVGRETKEDFLSQELPVPLLGLDLDVPLSARLDFLTGATGGYLPWVPSLRHEGGEVRLRQDEEELDAGLRWRVTERLTARGLAFWKGFGQDERSHEDGNRIRIDSGGLRLAASVTW